MDARTPQLTAAATTRGDLSIPSLDGIRAASFLIVFLAHAGLPGVPGYLGLSLFFFLSGYLITTLLRGEAERTGTVNLRSFYGRRALRIFPPYYTVLGLALLLTAVGALPGGPADVSGWPYQALHLTNYYIIRAGWWDGLAPGTWVYWSLAVEEHFYLVFPCLFLALRRLVPQPRRQGLVLLGLCALILAWRCWLVFGLHAPKDRLYVATDTRVDSILFGCVLALWGNPALDATAVPAHRWQRVWLPAGLALLFLSVVIRTAWYEQTLRYTLQGLALAPLFIVAVRFPGWGALRVLNHPWARRVGTLSYALYLVHTTVIHGVRQWVPAPAVVQGVLALGICFLAAAGIHAAVERPCARLRKYLVADRAAAGGPERPANAGLALGTAAHEGGTSR